MQPKLIYPLAILTIVLCLVALILFQIPLSNQQNVSFSSLPQTTPAANQIQPIDNQSAFSGLSVPVPSSDTSTPTPSPTPEFPISELVVNATPTPSPKLDFGDMAIPTPTPTPGINSLVPPGQ